VKRVYVQGYDTYVRFPDSVGDDEMRTALAERFPETDEQFVARIKDPSTKASEVSFDDFKRLREVEPTIDGPGLGELAINAAAITARELYDGVKSGISLAAQGKGDRAAASMAEGFARGTYDLETLGKRIENNFADRLEPYFMESEDAVQKSYNRFLAIKEMDNVREAARRGDETLLQEFGLTPDMIDMRLAEGSSYFLDPSTFVGFGSGRISSTMARVASSPVRLAGRAATGAASGIRRGVDAAASYLSRADTIVDEATGGLGKFALPTAAGVAGATVGISPLIKAAGVVPALELTGGVLQGFGEAMALSPTRTGGLARLAQNAPDTIAGKAAGYLKFLDKPIDYLGRGVGAGVVGSGVGAGLGGLAGGLEGAAQGFGSGFASGAAGGIAGRFVEGVSGSALRRAEDNDFRNWITQVDPEMRSYFTKYFTDHRSQTKGMDLVQILQTATAERGGSVQILSPKDYDARFKNKSEGASVVQGDNPVVYLRGVFDGKRGKDSALRLLAHEAFHAIARLDGFDILAKRIGQEVGKLYGPDEINQFIRQYENKLQSKRPTTTEAQRNAIIEELAAEYFANLITGKDSSYILKGDGLVGSVRNLLSRVIPGKLERMTTAFESPIFGPMKRSNSTLNRAIGDLVKARRTAYKHVELSGGEPVRVYTEADLGDDKVFNQLQDLGLAGLNAKGSRVMLRPGASNKISRANAEATAQALDQVPASVVDSEGGGLVRQPDGSYVGQRFSPSQIDAIINQPGMSNKVKEVLELIKQAGGIVNVTYAAATAKIKGRGKNKSLLTRYRNVPYTNRDVVPYQIIVSPTAGTVRMKVVDLSLLANRVAREWGENPAWQTMFGSVEGMITDLKTYINALGGDTPTATVLGSQEKRNVLNKFLQIRNVKGNPIIPEGTKYRGKTNPFLDFRLDRVVDMTPRTEVVKFSQEAYEKGQTNFSPSATDVDQLGMYSKAERAIKDLKQERGTGQQFMAALEKAGVKQEEIAETGLDKFLEDNPKTTKEDVLNHLLANQIEVNETVLGGRRVLTPDEQQRLAFLEAENDKKPLGSINDTVGDGAFDELLTLQNIRDGMSTEDLMAAQRTLERQRRFTEAEHLTARIENLELSGDFEDRTKYSTYTAPGSEQGTYRERILTLPKTRTGDFFDSPHFEQRNIVAHVRHNTRIGNFGERVLFIEEIQSDWHQQGRKKGYDDIGMNERFKMLHRSMDLRSELAAEIEKLNAEYDGILGRLSDGEDPKIIKELAADNRKKYNELQREYESKQTAERQLQDEGIAKAADAPFKKSWPELSMKRMLRVAAEEGFDAIAWTTGETQAKRFDLSEQVQRLEYNEVSQRLRGFKTGELGTLDPVLERSIAPHQLPDYIGKELSQKLLGQKIDGSGNHVIDGDDMKVDSGGMKGFYDRILPTLKTWKQVKGKDGKRLKVELRGVGKALKGHYVKLIPEHRASILEQGLPRFSPGLTELTQSRSLNDRGGAIYTNERGDRAIQLSSRSGVRVYSDRGKRIGPVFSSVEKAQDYLSRR